MKRFIFFLLLFFTVFNSCTHQCLRTEAHIVLVSFLPEETEEVVVRKFEKNSDFTTMISSFNLDRLSSTYQEANDSLAIFASYGSDNGLLSKYDYEIYLPRIDRLYQITGITETL